MGLRLTLFKSLIELNDGSTSSSSKGLDTKNDCVTFWKGKKWKKLSIPSTTTTRTEKKEVLKVSRLYQQHEQPIHRLPERDHPHETA